MRTSIGLGLAVLLLTTSACTGSTFVSPDAGGTDDGDGGYVPPNGGGSDAGTDAPVTVDAAPPPGCDTSKLPTDDACVVNDSEGVFVSSSLGAANGNGSKASPFASLNTAITAAKQAHRRVYACAESYAEQVQFQDGVDVFGYFACNSGWAIVQTSHAKIAAPASPAATAANITTATRVEAVDIYAPDYTTGSQSSIGLIATGSPALTIKNATIHAGTGGKGANGTDAIQLVESPSKNGAAARVSAVCTGTICFTSVASGGTNVCSGAVGHDGGPGGSGGAPGTYKAELFGVPPNESPIWNATAPTAPGNPTVATAQTAQGGPFDVTGSTGVAGSNGSSGNPGVAVGVLSASGYVPSDGTAATDGAPGQGGGGAGSYNDLLSTFPPGPHVGKTDMGIGAAGGGGGAGGCPGLAATDGKGGGASIAIVAVGSALSLETLVIESSDGGAGGQAGSASRPTTGGLGGGYAFDAPGGARGGDGGYAGVSGNGGGGPSIGVAWQGTQPTLLASTTKLGAGGSGVLARVGTDGQTIPASPAGLSQSSYAF